MPRLMDPTFVATNSKAGPILLALEQIPQEIRDEVEQVYAGLKANPNGRMRVGFDTVEELDLYTLQVTSYCEQRPGGKIRFRKSPTRNLPETYMDFRITDPLPETPAVAPAAPVVPAAPVPVPPVKATTRRR